MNQNYLKAFTVFLLSVSFFIIGCGENKIAGVSFLTTDSLPVQSFTVKNNRDTTLKTANGSLIRIENGSFSQDEVRLEVQEALSLEQMIAAGLTTMSDSNLLSSGGMINIHAANKGVEILKPIQVSLPTHFIDDSMKLYKGEEVNGEINWTKPEPLGKNQQPYLDSGRLLFEARCTTCHSLENDISGPALSGVESRGPWGDRQNLLRWVKNPPLFIPTTCYTINLLKQWGSIMPSFSGEDSPLLVDSTNEGEDRVLDTLSDEMRKEHRKSLTDHQILSIFDYIRSEDLKKGIDLTNSYDMACDDSCRQYNQIIRSFYRKKDSLIVENGDRIDLVMENLPSINNTPPTSPSVNKVTPVAYPAVYYKFDIKSFGWYNVDRLLLETDDPTELKVEITGNYKDQMSVFLAVPKYKIFGEGGPLKNETDVFGFYGEDGSIPLPHGTRAIVFCVSERDGKIFFDSEKFRSSADKRIVLKPKEISKEEFNKAVLRFRLDDISIEAKDTKNAERIRGLDAEIEKAAERYRPKNCKCDCVGIPQL